MTSPVLTDPNAKLPPGGNGVILLSMCIKNNLEGASGTGQRLLLRPFDLRPSEQRRSERMFLGPEALVFVKPGTGHTAEGPSDSSAANGSETAPNWERRPVGFGADAFEGPRDGAISPEKERKQQPESQSTIPLRLDQELKFFIRKEGHPGPLHSPFFPLGGPSSGTSDSRPQLPPFGPSSLT